MRKRNKLASGVLITALSAAFAPPAGGVPLMFQFSGEIDSVEDGLPISEEIAVGTTYSGVYQYDPDGTQDIDPHPGYATYLFGNDGFISVDIGAINIASTDLYVSIENTSILDAFKASNDSPFAALSVMWKAMELDFRDLTRTAFDSDALPLTAPNLADFQFTTRFAMYEVDHRFPSITGTVDTLTMIPELSSLATLFAAAMLASLRRRHADRPEHLTVPTPQQ